MSISSTTLDSHAAIANAVFNDIATRNNAYYYYYGKNLPFGTTLPEDAISNAEYENTIRKNMVLLKRVNINDVTFAIKRITWKSGDIYDMYDDTYHGAKVTTINVTNGGSNYSNTPTVVVQSPTSGTSAQAYAIVENGVITNIGIFDGGYGYTTAPLIGIYDSTGTGATAQANISSTYTAHSGASSLDIASFYAITSDLNVYKCLDNNNNSASTIMPTHTTPLPVIESDGYMWKFMYKIPQTLQNKWLVPSYIPVTKQSTNAFYNNGGIGSVQISNSGTGYTNSPATTIIPYGEGIGGQFIPIISDYTGSIKEVQISNTGSNYKAITTKHIKSISRVSGIVTVVTNSHHKLQSGVSVTLSGDATYSGTFIVTVSNPNTFTYSDARSNSNTNYGLTTVNSYTKSIATISRTNNVVTVVTSSAHTLNEQQVITISGTANFNYSVRISKVVNNTTFQFSAVGTDVTESVGTITMASIVINSITVNSNVATVVLDSAHNLTTGDTVTLSNINVTFDTIHTITVVDLYTYTFPITTANTTITYPYITYNTGLLVSSGTGSGKYGNAHALISANILVQSGAYTDGTISVTITPVNGGTGGAAHAIASGNIITNIVIDNQGSGYIAPPTITIGNGTAKAIAHVYNGKIVSIELDSYIDTISIIDPGKNYSSGQDCSISISGDGSGAIISPILDDTGKIISTIINSAGSGYTYANLTVNSSSGSGAKLIANLNYGNIDTLQYLNELQSINGAIFVCKITNNGTGYTTATVTITGDGIGATATATISGGHITKINMTNYGTGYTFANITITGDGINATARAIISPNGGHGKDAVKELYARNLLFFSNINNNDLLNNINITNDYRQYGIIKSPKLFGSGITYTNNIGNGCYTIYGTFTESDYTNDDNLYITVSGTNYNINLVQVSSTFMLVIPIDGYIPQIGDTIYKNASKHFVISNVISPDIDKYSGELLYINNSLPFTQSANQSIKSRTILSF